MIMTGNLYSQSFEYIYQTTDDEVISDAVQDVKGNYFLVGSIGNSLPPSQGDKSGLIIKIDSLGQYIDSKIINSNQDYISLGNIILDSDSTFLITGYRIPIGMSNSLIYTLKLDTALNILSEQSFGDFAYNNQISKIYKINLDTLIFVGSVQTYSPQINSDIIFGMMSTNGDSISMLKFGNPNGFQMGFDLLVYNNNIDSVYLFVYGMLNTPMYPLEVIKLSSNFGLDSIAIIPISSTIRTMSAKWISLTTFLVGTSGYENVWSLDKSLGIGKFDITFNCIDTLFFGVADTNEHEAGFCIDFKTVDKVYFGGTKNSSLFFSPFESYYYIIRMDTSFNVSFVKSIGYQNDCLGLYKVLATSDGGVLLAGTKYDAATANGQERDIYVIKLDSLGNYVTGTGNSPIEQVHDFIVYPNPAASQLTF